MGKKQFAPIIILFLEDQSEQPLFRYEAHSKILQIHHEHGTCSVLIQKLMLSDI